MVTHTFIVAACCNLNHLSGIWEGFCEEVGRFGAFLVWCRPQKPLKTVLLGSALSLSMPVFSQWRRRLEKFLRCNRKRFFYVKTQTQMLCFVVLTSYFCSKQLSTLDKWKRQITSFSKQSFKPKNMPLAPEAEVEQKLSLVITVENVIEFRFFFTYSTEKWP